MINAYEHHSDGVLEGDFSTFPRGFNIYLSTGFFTGSFRSGVGWSGDGVTVVNEVYRAVIRSLGR